MRKLCTKIIPKNLRIKQKDSRKDEYKVTEISSRMWLQVTKHGSLSTIQKQKRELKNGTHLHYHVQKTKNEQVKNKILLICFFDSQGIVPTEFVPQGQTVNQFYYHELLERLRKRVVRLRPNIANNWMLHHDNAPYHMAISGIEFLAKKGIPVVPQPPYSPDLSPWNFFFLVPKTKVLP